MGEIESWRAQKLILQLISGQPRSTVTWVTTMNITSNPLTVTLAAGMFASPALAQNTAPVIKFDSVLGAIQLPGGLYFGEVAGVATNSKGDIFVYTRTGHLACPSRTADRGCSTSIARASTCGRSGKTPMDLWPQPKCASTRLTISGRLTR